MGSRMETIAWLENVMMGSHPRVGTPGEKKNTAELVDHYSPANYKQKFRHGSRKAEYRRLLLVERMKTITITTGDPVPETHYGEHYGGRRETGEV